MIKQGLINMSLANVSTAATALSNPQDSFKSIHVAGTNGKGSVCTWLELMFMASDASQCGVAMTEQASLRQRAEGVAGSNPLCIAKYISPHLINVTERISVNGKDISQKDFDALWFELYGGTYDTDAYRSEITQPGARLFGQSLTEFEKLTLLAFEWFKRSQVDLAIIEVGLGGRLDATNIISPDHCLATAITNIGLDHQEYLGNTIEEITKEKRGILKPRVPHFEGMLTGAEPNGEEGSNYLLAKQIYLHLSDNSVILSAKREGSLLRGSIGVLHCVQDDVRCAARNASYKELAPLFRSRYRGRFDESIPGLILDGAHNPHAALELNRYLRNKYPNKAKTWIIGMLDKDHKSFLDNLFDNLLNPELDQIIFTRVNNSRSKDPKELESHTLSQYPKIKIYSYKDLYSCINSQAMTQDPSSLTIVTGSLYLLGEFIKINK